MNKWSGTYRAGRRRGPGVAPVEALEPRKLLSATATATLHPQALFLHQAAAGPAALQGVLGLSPQQVRHAYGFDRATFGNGAVAAEGLGQTIAIVDAFSDPAIASDLAVFDAQFGLNPPPDFQIVNQRGNPSALPSSAGANAAGWAGETSLDVEWAHAIAPQANILLVEADSDSLANLIAGVQFARTVAGVSVVSMSWGGSEFFNFAAGSESGSETQYDGTFLTPAGHQGITFLAAAGDSGASKGVLYPAASPNVVSVGGTSLTLNADDTIANESSWDGTSGGTSQVEPTPVYQFGAQPGSFRDSPDVAYDGDPNTGFAVYDSIPSQGQSGWQVVGGTSAGSPQWAALVAIADQGRALAGQGSLDGVSQTLPLLYGAYAAPGSAGSATYNATFNDVTDTGSTAPIQWRWGGIGGGFANPATPGFDTATGLGSPRAPQVISLLVGAATPTPTPTPVPTPTPTPASPISADFPSAPSGSVRGGSTGTLNLRLSNTSGQVFRGPVSITLYASPDASVSDGTLIDSVSVSQLKLRAGASKKIKLKFTYPADLNGSYYLVGSVDATGGATPAAEAATSAPLAITKPNLDLATTFGGGAAVAVSPGRNNTVAVILRNVGNVNAAGAVSVDLYGAAGQTLDVNNDLFLNGISGRRINLRPGQSKTLRIRFVAPQDAGGTYNLIANTTFAGLVSDGNSSNDTAVIATA